MSIKAGLPVVRRSGGKAHFLSVTHLAFPGTWPSCHFPSQSVAAQAPSSSGPKPCNRGFFFFSCILSTSESCRLAFRIYPRAALLGEAVTCMLSFKPTRWVTMGLEAGTLPSQEIKSPQQPVLTLSPRVGISSPISSPGFALLFCLRMRVMWHLANPTAASVLRREGSVLPLTGYLFVAF